MLFYVCRTYLAGAMKISQMNEGDRPREKMLAKGCEALSDTELLAILLRTGNRSVSVMDMAHELLSACDGNLIRLFNMDMESMCACKGIKRDKAVTVRAAFELGRRFLNESSGVLKIPITTAEDIYRMMIPALKGLMHEECWVLYLNRARFVIKKERMSSGGGCSTTMDLRDIIKSALSQKAYAIILVHNHPSGNPEPGREDIRQTDALKKAAASMDIQLLDHVVVCDDCYFSFCDERISYLTAPCEALP